SKRDWSADVCSSDLAPLLGTIGASLAYEGLMMGPIIYLLGMNIVLLLVKLMSGMLGYNLGTSIIGTLTSQIEKISRVASMIGVQIGRASCRELGEVL